MTDSFLNVDMTKLKPMTKVEWLTSWKEFQKSVKKYQKLLDLKKRKLEKNGVP